MPNKIDKMLANARANDESVLSADEVILRIKNQTPLQYPRKKPVRIVELISPQRDSYHPPSNIVNMLSDFSHPYDLPELTVLPGKLVSYY